MGTLRLERIAWEGAQPPRPDEMRAALESAGFAVFSWRDAAGTLYEPHQHEEDECLWLIDGEMSFEIDGRRYDLGAGDRLMLPARTVHAAQAGPGGAAYLVGQRR